MNEIAFKAAMFKPDVLSELRKIELWETWATIYLDD